MTAHDDRARDEQPATIEDQFGTTCIDCGEAIDDRRPYAPTDDGELMHVGCGDDGMDVEAQGEMADELTAAQAAIQRLRELADEYEAGHGGVVAPVLVKVAARIRRALDGDTRDTTEEQR